MDAADAGRQGIALRGPIQWAALPLRPHGVTPQTLHRLATAAAWTIVGTTVVANETERSPLVTLRQGGELSCQPSLPHFCENMHVRCAGQTAIATFPFRLRVAPGSNSVALAASDEDNQRQYESATVEWAEDGSCLLLSPRSSNGYVKLLEDGKYVFRHYIQGRGVMSLGHCK